MAGVDLHGAGDGLEGTVPEVVEGLLVQVVLLLTQALLKQLPLVSELDHRLGVGVEGGDGGGHAAGEGAPGHAGSTETQKYGGVHFLTRLAQFVTKAIKRGGASSLSFLSELFK